VGVCVAVAFVKHPLRRGHCLAKSIPDSMLARGFLAHALIVFAIVTLAAIILIYRRAEVKEEAGANASHAI
jgi:cbb3-type cytochrome oxidase subunit 3